MLPSTPQGEETNQLTIMLFYRFITPWVEESGFVPPIMTNMSLMTLWCLFGFVFYFKGKTFRRWSRNSNVHKL
jgi:hypothetical protein